jgi:bacteriocin-type transport-associated protein
MKKVLFILGILSDADIEWILNNGVREKISPGKVLIQEGDPISSIYIVLDGLFSVTVAGLGHKEVAQLGVGEMIGEISFVDSRPPSATVTAISNCLILSITKKILEERLKYDVGFAARFYRALAIFLSDRLRETMNRISYDDNEPMNQEIEYQDELDLNVLENISMAGSRFERILRQLRGDV